MAKEQWIFVLIACVASAASAAITGQWDFNAGDLSATVGAALKYRGNTGAATQFGTTSGLGIPAIAGQEAHVMRFPACSPSEGFIMFHGAEENNGGARVNSYTIVLDVLFPSTSEGFRSFWQTDTNNTTDAELFVNAGQGIGISGQYQGNLSPDTWHRVAFTVDCSRRELGKFIDGTNVLSGPVGAAPLGTNAMQYLDATAGTTDGRWALDPAVLLFADENGETGVGYINSIQFHNRVLSPSQVAALGRPTASGIPFIASSAVAQWDFNGSLGSSTGGSNLIAGAAAPATLPSFTFSNVTINGQAATVASFSRGTLFRTTHGLGVNGGGSFLNVYTLVMDVMFPSRPTGWAVLWQTSPANANDGDWFINPAGGVGISGVYGGSVPNGTWNRLALVVNCVDGTLTSYINGTQAQQLGGLSLDGRWAIGPDALLFADENEENAAGLVNSVQLRPVAMSAADIAAMAGPSAAGIPVPSPPTLQLLGPNGGESFQAGSTQSVSWAAGNPSGLVVIDVYRGDLLHRQLGEVSMRQSNFNWVINSRIGDGTNYRIRIASSSFPGISDFSDAQFTIFASGTPANPLFGQPLQANGGFEAALSNWQTIFGNPRTLSNSGGKGSPHSGTLFFHGGPGNSNAVIVRQEIDLIAAGFTAQDIDGGAVLDAEAWLRNWLTAGNFDDQIYYAVSYLGAAGATATDDQALSGVRCIIPAHNAWIIRRLSGLLPAGTRRLRVDVVGNHRRDSDNDSMADDLVVRLQEGSGVVTPQITKLPMLQDVRPDAMTLLWETDGNLARHAVEWGSSNVAENTFTAVETLQIDPTHFVHRATLTGLSGETHYVYRVRSGDNATAVFSFRTAPHRDTPFAVAWWGDNHQGTVTLRQHIANMSAHGPDFIAVAGDMVNSGNVLSEWHDYWFKPLEHLNLGQTKPIIFARGNHDGEHALAYAYSKLPGNEAWFAFDYGNSRFIFLDSEVNSAGSPEQLAWLRAELQRPETRQAAFRIVCFHKPPWCNLWNGGGYTGEPFVRSEWTPLFAEGLVDIIICGHAHNYNRGETNGVTYIISGGGGGTLDVERVAFWPLFTVEYSRYHYGLMEVNGDTLLWEVYDNNNALIDTMTLKSRTPTLQWESSTSGGTLSLVISGRAGVTYVLEESPDLTTWTTLSNSTLAANGWRTNAVPNGAQQRFFRARTQ